ncbi:Bestrophin, RFP-TM, chloride channel-domain-containing protein [Xylogone sp. PMI_703]|nr:Bestrophin, RFP-TM, chloride channel-domain-containing protein [Xylogone sp. PMI_703]
MADDAPAPVAATAPPAVDHDSHTHADQPNFLQNRHDTSRKSTWTKSILDFTPSGAQTPMSLGRMEHIDGFDSYFVGPRNLDAHSKLPYFLRLHGSVTPRLILPILIVGGWATCITCISRFVSNLSVSNLLLTVLGFVISLALSFRSSTAYERYSDGRKAWATLSVQCRNLARYFWVHVEERPECSKDDLLAKITAMNLILAFAVSLKHKLRFEPYAHYPDLASLIGHLDTFAKNAHKEENMVEQKKTPWKRAGEFLGLSVAMSNPRKALKRADRPLGNLPLEILTYLSAYVEEVNNNGTLKSAIVFGQIMTSLAALTDTQSNAERVLTTPLPVGYNILISQIVLLYVYLLPFQLYNSLGWVTIPGTMAAAYIILGLAAIGNELENPFGNDVNDLPLDQYCEELANEINTLTSVPAPKFGDVMRKENKVLWPLSEHGYESWTDRTEDDIRHALKTKVLVGKGVPFAQGPRSLDGVTLDA